MNIDQGREREREKKKRRKKEEELEHGCLQDHNARLKQGQ